MSAEEDAISTHIEIVDVNGENVSNSEKSSDSGIEVVDGCSDTLPSSSDSEISPIKTADNSDVANFLCNDLISVNNAIPNSNLLSSTISSSPNSLPNDPHASNALLKDENLAQHPPVVIDESSSECEIIHVPNNYEDTSFEINNILTTSTGSLDEQICCENVISKPPYSRSAESILVSEDKFNSNCSDNRFDKETILSQFTSQKHKALAVQKIPEISSSTFLNESKLIENVSNDGRYPRIPKEILSQDIGSIVKNVHGIFSSVSGSLKYAYNQRSAPKPIKALKPVPNSKVMNDIFEDESKEVTQLNEPLQTSSEVSQLNTKMESMYSLENLEDMESLEQNSDAKNDVLKLQVESLERLLYEQRKENASLRERVKQQGDDLLEKDQTFKELEVKLDVMSKRVEQAEREKDAAVMRYASVECAGIEAKRAAENAAKAEKMALAEVELLNSKLKGAHVEKQRIIQLYDDKCHELQNCDRELSKVREDIKELEGRLKWTQSKLRMEMDAYKDSSERVEKLSQQVTELEAAKEAAVLNSADSVRARQLEAELKECRAALILCRHEKEEMERKYTSTYQQLDTCKKERDDACSSLVEATMEVEELKISNLRLEEEAAELAALRAKAALADTLSAQLQRESERASLAEEALSAARAQGETCLAREAGALEHAARLTQLHVAERHRTAHHEAKAQALSADNLSLRERVRALEEDCSKLRLALAEETERRHKENKVLARKVAEVTEEAAEANKRLEWEKGENGVLKKKHSSAIKELNRELQRALKRCEQLEAKLPPPDAPSTRTGSVSSLSSVESAQTEERPQNGHADGMPDIQVREPDRQALIERIVSLQRAAARRAERCEFLEEHSKQLTSELRNKSRLLRHMLSAMPAGAVASEDRDMNKKEIARLGGGAMAAVWGGDPTGMTLELSLEMNKRLQAVLEDTLLKNITLKENMDTLGAEISRLKSHKMADVN